MYRRTGEQLTEFVKKKYQSCFVDEVLSLYNEVETKNKIIEELTTKITSLETKINSPEFTLSEAFSHYFEAKGFDIDTVERRIRKEVKSAVKRISVDVEGYYEEYSGQNDHYHKATVSLNNY